MDLFPCLICDTAELFQVEELDPNHALLLSIARYVF
jgi:hypothetical protein